MTLSTRHPARPTLTALLAVLLLLLPLGGAGMWLCPDDAGTSRVRTAETPTRPCPKQAGAAARAALTAPGAPAPDVVPRAAASVVDQTLAASDCVFVSCQRHVAASAVTEAAEHGPAERLEPIAAFTSPPPGMDASAGWTAGAGPPRPSGTGARAFLRGVVLRI